MFRDKSLRGQGDELCSERRMIQRVPLRCNPVKDKCVLRNKHSQCLKLMPNNEAEFAKSVVTQV